MATDAMISSMVVSALAIIINYPYWNLTPALSTSPKQARVLQVLDKLRQEIEQQQFRKIE